MLTPPATEPTMDKHADEALVVITLGTATLVVCLGILMVGL